MNKATGLEWSASGFLPWSSVSINPQNHWLLTVETRALSLKWKWQWQPVSPSIFTTVCCGKMSLVASDCRIFQPFSVIFCLTCRIFSIKRCFLVVMSNHTMYLENAECVVESAAKWYFTRGILVFKAFEKFLAKWCLSLFLGPVRGIFCKKKKRTEKILFLNRMKSACRLKLHVLSWLIWVLLLNDLALWHIHCFSMFFLCCVLSDCIRAVHENTKHCSNGRKTSL